VVVIKVTNLLVNQISKKPHRGGEGKELGGGGERGPHEWCPIEARFDILSPTRSGCIVCLQRKARSREKATTLKGRLAPVDPPTYCGCANGRRRWNILEAIFFRKGKGERYLKLDKRGPHRRKKPTLAPRRKKGNLKRSLAKRLRAKLACRGGIAYRN